ncbi:MAG: hypothetical protein JSR95_09850 [Proteobacteria bacterium]|nr:hypothetical protein [Pseudomonadota bacterium]
MNRIHWAWVLAALAATSQVRAGDVNVGISIGIDQPGLYGRIDIGNVPPPALVYPRPVLIVSPPPTVVVAAPLYLHVPPGHAKHWRKHCHEYDACGRPVYFVQDRWYNEVYVPARRERPRYHERGDEHGRGHGHGHDHDEDHDRGHDRH